MFNLYSLTIEGFGKILETQTVFFQNEIYYVTAENHDTNKASSNGSSKTSLLNCILWCLYGKTFTHSVTEVVSKKASKCSVVAYFTSDEFGVLEVNRWYSNKHNLYYSLNGVREEGDVTITQKKLNDVLGLDWEGFQTSCCMFSEADASKFLEATPATRAKLLSDLVDDRIFQRAATQMETDAKYYKEQMATGQNNIELLEKQIKYKEDQLSLLHIKYTKASQEELNRKTIIEMKIAALQNEMKQQLAFIMNPPQGDIAQVQADISYLKGEHKKQYDELKYLEFQIKSAESIMLGGNCKTCKRYVDHQALAHFQQVTQEEQTLYQHMSQKLHETQTNIEQATAMYHSLFNYNNQKNAAEERMAEIKVAIMDLEESYNHNMLEYLDQQRNDLTQELLGMQNYIDEIKQNQAKWFWYADKLKYLIPGFKSMVRNIMFDLIRGDLERFTNEFAADFADNMFTIQYPSKDQIAKEKFEIIMSENGELRDISTFSKGERWRGCFSCLLALRQIMRNKTKTNLNFILIDDPMGDIDETGCEELWKVLDRIHKVERNLILVTLPRMDLVPPGRRIHIVRQNHKAKIYQDQAG